MKSKFNNLIVLPNNLENVGLNEGSVLHLLQNITKTHGIEATEIALDTRQLLSQSPMFVYDIVGRTIEQHIQSMIAVLLAFEKDAADSDQPNSKGRKAGGEFLHIWHIGVRESFVHCSTIHEEAATVANLLVLSSNLDEAILNFRARLVDAISLKEYCEHIANVMLATTAQYGILENIGNEFMRTFEKNMGKLPVQLTSVYAMMQALGQFDPQRAFASGVANLIYALNTGLIETNAAEPFIELFNSVPTMEASVRNSGIATISQDEMNKKLSSIKDILGLVGFEE